MTTPALVKHATRQAATRAVVDEIVAAVDAALARTGAGRASLCLSGGSSPVAAYRQLAGRSLPWDRVDLTLSDERWVPAADPDSNEGLLRRELLAGGAAGACLHGLYRDGATPREAARVVSRELAEAFPRPFDYCLLGMGGDGHTASLFPDDPHLDAALHSEVAAVAVSVPRLSHPRLSLAPWRLLHSHRIGLLLFGDEKLSVLEEALNGEDLTVLPVRIVLHQERVPITCHWAP